MTEAVKRQYRSPARAAAAAHTRARIREAAAACFVERGYVATTMREVARAAGVGERTLYDAYSSKADLFTHTLGVAIVGDEEPLPVADRAEIHHALTAEPGAGLKLIVEYTARLLDRAGDLIVVSIEASGADPDMRTATEEGARETHRLYSRLNRAWQRRGALRPGLDPATAADIMYAVASPHTHHLLRRHRHWSARRYRRWLEQTLGEQLLGTRAAP